MEHAQRNFRGSRRDFIPKSLPGNFFSLLSPPGGEERGEGEGDDGSDARSNFVAGCGDVMAPVTTLLRTALSAAPALSMAELTCNQGWSAVGSAQLHLAC